jgi:5-methylcytosine-specific restriction endonuclease McrA
MRHLTLDHIIPRHRGGPHTWRNLVAACTQCNRRKGGKSAREANMYLQRKPFEPKATAVYRFGSHIRQNQEWAQFIEGW